MGDGIYSGTRDDNEIARAFYTTADGGRVELNPRLDLSNHSPTGFEWGYGGSGPAQLALAILAHRLHDDERALALHQRFKFAVVGNFARSGWTMSSEAVDDVVDELLEQDSEREAERLDSEADADELELAANEAIASGPAAADREQAAILYGNDQDGGPGGGDAVISDLDE